MRQLTPERALIFRLTAFAKAMAVRHRALDS